MESFSCIPRLHRSTIPEHQPETIKAPSSSHPVFQTLYFLLQAKLLVSEVTMKYLVVRQIMDRLPSSGSSRREYDLATPDLPRTILRRRNRHSPIAHSAQSAAPDSSTVVPIDRRSGGGPRFCQFGGGGHRVQL